MTNCVSLGGATLSNDLSEKGCECGIPKKYVARAKELSSRRKKLERRK